MAKWEFTLKKVQVKMLDEYCEAFHYSRDEFFNYCIYTVLWMGYMKTQQCEPATDSGIFTHKQSWLQGMFGIPPVSYPLISTFHIPFLDNLIHYHEAVLLPTFVSRFEDERTEVRVTLTGDGLNNDVLFWLKKQKDSSAKDGKLQNDVIAAGATFLRELLQGKKVGAYDEKGKEFFEIPIFPPPPYVPEKITALRNILVEKAS